jgi:hypothetical protein
MVQPSATTVGKTYAVEYTVDAVALAGDGIVVDWTGAATHTTVGRKRQILAATSTSFSIKRAGTACDIQISNISVRELSGNHAFQPTAASRPIWSARKNLLLATDALATQSVTVLASPKVLSFWGSGSIALSGAVSGTLTGVDENTRVYMDVAAVAGTITLTVSGQVLKAQLEDVV